MTTRVQARHRASVRPRTPLTDLGDGFTRAAGTVGRGGAVAVAAGGLVVSVALPAGAATPADAPAATTTSVETAVDSAFASTTVAPAVTAPATAGAAVVAPAAFSAVPKPKPVVVAPVVVPAARTTSTAPSSADGDDATAGTAAAQRSERPASRASTRSAPAQAEEAPAAEAADTEVSAQPAASEGGGSLGAQVLAVADDYAGVPYVYGGTTPSGFDCSGYTSYVFAKLGVDLPRTANAQKGASQRIGRGDAVPGDLVFFSNGSGRAYHVGIYAGGNKMWDAPRSGKPVQLRSIWSDSATFGRVAPVA